jgi:hypothetical protein
MATKSKHVCTTSSSTHDKYLTYCVQNNDCILTFLRSGRKHGYRSSHGSKRHWYSGGTCTVLTTNRDKATTLTNSISYTQPEEVDENENDSSVAVRVAITKVRKDAPELWAMSTWILMALSCIRRIKVQWLSTLLPKKNLFPSSTLTFMKIARSCYQSQHIKIDEDAEDT